MSIETWVALGLSLLALIGAVVLIKMAGRMFGRANALFEQAGEFHTWCASQGYHYSDFQTFRVEERSDAMERLVKWLALSFRILSYDDDGTEHVTWNTPIFPSQLPWGEEMPEAIHMRSLYHSVVGPSTDGQYTGPVLTE